MLRFTYSFWFDFALFRTLCRLIWYGVKWCFLMSPAYSIPHLHFACTYFVRGKHIIFTCHIYHLMIAFSIETHLAMITVYGWVVGLSDFLMFRTLIAFHFPFNIIVVGCSMFGNSMFRLFIWSTVSWQHTKHLALSCYLHTYCPNVSQRLSLT